MASEPWVGYFDESIRNDVITVGGFIARAEDLSVIRSRWRILKKKTLDLAPSCELKYTMQPGHPGRAALDAAGFTQATRIPLMLSAISKMPLLIVVNTLIDRRHERAPLDLYVDALRWCIRRLANHVEIDLRGIGGVHSIVVDLPSRPQDLHGRTNLSDRMRRLLAQVGTAPFDAYADLFAKPEIFVSRPPATRLKDLGFAPELRAAHAKYSDPLQVADVIASCVNEFCAYNRAGCDSWGGLPLWSYQDDNFAAIAGRCRGGSRIQGYGFDLFPVDDIGVKGIVDHAEELARKAC